MTGRRRSDGIKTGVESLRRDELGGDLLIAQAVPGLRWRELGSGSGAERVNLRCDTDRPVGAGESEIPK
jgi:hypothetical protein